MKNKCMSGKVSLLRRFNQAMVPVTNCLGRHDTSYPQLIDGNISLSLTQQQAHNLHTVFGRGTEVPESLTAGVFKLF